MVQASNVHSVLKCDCKGETSYTILWANQYGGKTRYFCCDCYAYSDVLYSHKALGEMIVRTGIIRNHHRRKVEKEQCYFCDIVLSLNLIVDYPITRITAHPETHEELQQQVTVKCCVSCLTKFEAAKGELDDIPF